MSAKFYEIPTLRNKRYVFKDRDEAGKVMAQMLEPYYQEAKETLVLAIPSGGVPVGIQIAKALNLPMDLMIVRKIPIPGNPEAGMGALTLEGSLFLNEELIKNLHLTPYQVEAQINRVKEELAIRNRLFRASRPPADVEGLSVILADDGLASGFTMLACVETVKRKGAEKVVVAVPTTSESALSRLLPLVDEIFCPNLRQGMYYAVADAYEQWRDLDRYEVIDLLSGLPKDIYPGPHPSHSLDY